MVFKSEAQLKEHILKKCRNAIAKTQDKVYKILDLYMQRFYSDYDPELYKRTYQLMKSLVKSDVHQIGNEIKAEVYFDLGYIYKTGSTPSGEQVMDAAAYGGHGAKGLNVVYGGGEDAWFTPLEIIDAEAIETLKNMLIAEGIPIR